MGIMGAILAGVGAVCAALGIVAALEVTNQPIISEHFTWPFWFGLATILFLASIASLLGRGPGSVTED
jgi:hypothetical protein